MEREKRREKERQSRLQPVSKNNVNDKKELFGTPVKVHNSTDTNTSRSIEDILNEMTVGFPLVSDIEKTPRVTIVDSKYTAEGKAEPQQRMSPKDTSESLKKMLGEPKPLFPEPPVQRNNQLTSNGVSPDAAVAASNTAVAAAAAAASNTAAAAAAAAAASVPMDAKPSGPYNQSLFASYMLKPSVREGYSNVIPPQPPQQQDSQPQQQLTSDAAAASSSSKADNDKKKVPVTDLHKKHLAFAKCEKKDIIRSRNDFLKSYEKPKVVERKSTSISTKKEEPVEEPVKKKRGRMKDSDDEDEPPKALKMSEKRRCRQPGKKSKVVSASNELEEECTDISRKKIKDSEIKSSHSLRKTPSCENQPQKSVALVSNEGSKPQKMSLMCKIPLNKLPASLNYLIKPARSEELRTCADLTNTRQEEKKQKHRHHKHHHKSSPAQLVSGTKKIKFNESSVNIAPPTQPLFQQPSSDNYSKGMMDNVNVIQPILKDNEGSKPQKMSLMCKIPLSKLPASLNYLIKPARSEELRTRADLANTRQEVKKQKHRHHKHHHKSSPAQLASGTKKFNTNESPANTAPPTQPLLDKPSSDNYSKGMMDNVNVWRKPASVCAVIPEAKVKSLEHCTMSYMQRPINTSLMHTIYDDNSDGEDGGPPPSLPFSTNAVRKMDQRYKRSLESDQYSQNTAKRRKCHSTTGSPGLGRYAATRGDGFFSYFVTDQDPENTMHQEVPLKEAQALTKLAEDEPDPMTREMKFLDGILFYVLSGHLMENEGTRKRAVLKIYNETIDLIKVIWSKIYNYRADCDHEIFEMAHNPKRDNRLLILWMRCLSFLRLKLFKLSVDQNREPFKTVQQHFLKNVGSSPISPTSGAAASSGAAAGIIDVPIVVDNALYTQHVLYCHLAAAHDMWSQADLLVMRGKHTQFFVEMDRHCGPLTLHSTGQDLTLYARIAISRMRCEFNIKNYLL